MSKYDPLPKERKKCQACGKPLPVPAWKCCIGCEHKPKKKTV